MCADIDLARQPGVALRAHGADVAVRRGAVPHSLPQWIKDFRENIGAGRFFRAGRAGDWRRHLTAAQVRDAVDAHHRVMSAMGYSERLPAG